MSLSGGKEQVLRDMGGDDPEHSPWLRRLPGLRASTLRDLRLRNRTSVALEARFEATSAVELLDQARMDEMRQTPAFDDFWSAFQAGHPGSNGLIGFSRVGFDPLGDQALVYAGKSRGWLAGAGYFLLLRREAKTGRWIVVSILDSWVS